MATRYINRASTAGGDGTTNNTSGATRAYESMSEADAARQSVLSEIEEWICEGSSADTAVTEIAGWTTTASFYIDIKALSSAATGRHNGVWSTSHYRISASSAFNYALVIRQPFTRITGIQVENTHATSGYSAFRYEPAVTAAADDGRFDSLICRKATWADDPDSHGHAIQQRDGKGTWRNCVGYQGIGNGLVVDSGPQGPATAIVDNCVFANNGNMGINARTFANTVHVKNTYCGGNGVTDFDPLITDTNGTITTSHSEDATGNTQTAYSTSSGARFVNITTDSEDFHIQALSALIGVGTDLSGSFTADIDEQTRSAPWDVGVHELILLPPASVLSASLFPKFRMRRP